MLLGPLSDRQGVGCVAGRNTVVDVVGGFALLPAVYNMLRVQLLSSPVERPKTPPADHPV